MKEKNMLYYFQLKKDRQTLTAEWKFLVCHEVDDGKLPKRYEGIDPQTGNATLSIDAKDIDSPSVLYRAPKGKPPVILAYVYSLSREEACKHMWRVLKRTNLHIVFEGMISYNDFPDKVKIKKEEEKADGEDFILSGSDQG